MIAALALPDGSILGIGGDHQLYSRTAVNAPWVLVANSGAVISIAYMTGGILLGVGTDNQLYTRATLTAPWVLVPGSGLVKAVTVMPDGTLLGVGMSNRLWTRSNLTSPWVLVPDSGSVVSVTVLADGTLLGVGMSNRLWTRATLTSPWVLVPNSGSVLTVTLMADGTLLGVGTDNQLCTLSALPTAWAKVPNSGLVKAVTVMPDGTFLGIGMSNRLWTRATLASPWVIVPDSGSVLSVAVMADGTLLGVGTDNQLYTRLTLTSPWVFVPDSGSVLAVTVLADGTLLGVGTDNQLYTRSTLTSHWKLVANGGAFIAVAQRSDGTFIGVGTDQMVYTVPDLPGDWARVPESGSVIGITITYDGLFVGIGKDNCLYSRRNFANWVGVPGSGSVLSAAYMIDGSLLGVGTDNQLYARATLTGPWLVVPRSGAVMWVAVLADGTLLGVGMDNQLYTRATLTSPWLVVPGSGSVKAVTQRPDGSFLGVGTDNNLYIRATLTSPWLLVPDSGPVLVVIAMVDGTLLGVGTDNQLYTRATLIGPWVPVPRSGGVIAVIQRPDGTLLGVGTDLQLHTLSTLPDAWVMVPDSGLVEAVTVMIDGSLLGVGTDNQLYTRATLTSPWVFVPGSGAVMWVAVLADGTLLGVGMDNQLYTRATLTSPWVHVPGSGSVKAVTQRPDGSFLGVGTDNNLYSRAMLTSPWVPVPGGGSIIAAISGDIYPPALETRIVNRSSWTALANGVPIAPGHSILVAPDPRGVRVDIAGRGAILVSETNQGYRDRQTNSWAAKISSGPYAAYWPYEGQSLLALTINADGTFSAGPDIDRIPILSAIDDFGASLAGGSLSIPSNQAYDFGIGDFTVEALFQTHEAGTIVSRSGELDGSHKGAWILSALPSGAIQLDTFDHTAQYWVKTGILDIFQGSWHHVAVVRRDGVISFYFDGDLTPVTMSPSHPTVSLNSSSPVTLGASLVPGYPHFVGVLEDVAIWNVALTRAQLLPGLFNRIRGDEPGLVGYWPMDGDGTDRSRTRNDATISGAVTFIPVVHCVSIVGDNSYAYCAMDGDGAGTARGNSVLDTPATVRRRTQKVVVPAGAPFLYAILYSNDGTADFPSGALLTIVGPDGTAYNQATDTPNLLVQMLGESLRCLVVAAPQAGAWTITLSAPADLGFNFQFHTIPSTAVGPTMMGALATVYSSGTGGLQTRDLEDWSGLDTALAVVALGAMTAVMIAVTPAILAGTALSATAALVRVTAGAIAGAAHAALYVRASSGIGLAAATNKLVGKANFTPGPALTVHIWSLDYFREAFGHASLTLSDGTTHISWWPRTRDRVPLLPVKKDEMPFLGTVYEAPAYPNQTFLDDVRMEDGVPPDYQIKLRVLDEAAIKAWWNRFKSTRKWRMLDENCSTAVMKALVAGGALRVLSHNQVVALQATLVWTPSDVQWLANRLAAHNPT